MKNKKEKRQTVGRKYNRFGSILWAFQRFWREDKGFVISIFTITPVLVALQLVQSYFPKVLIDNIGMGVDFAKLAVLCCMFVAVNFSLTAFKQFLDSRCLSRHYDFSSRYQMEMEWHSNYFTDYENTEKQDYREVEGYAVRDASGGDCSTENVWINIAHFTNHLLGIVTYASLLAFIDPVIFVIVAVVSVLTYFTTRWETTYREKNKHHWEKEDRKLEYLEDLSDNFPAAKDIKLYALEGWLDKMMHDYQAFNLMWSKRTRLRYVWGAMLSGAMTLMQDGAAYLFLIAMLLRGELSVGDFVFYFSVVGGIATYLTKLITDIANLNSRAEKIAYYRNLFDYPTTFNHGEGCPLPAGPVKIELKDVWYKYAGAEDYTIKGLNLTIDGGESIALVGMNGAGKTTLVKLICGFYAPTRGDILVNGRKIEEYNIEEYYSLISAVFQKVSPIACTMFEFVASVDRDRPTAREDAVAAMKVSGIWEKIETLPNGVDTHLVKNVYDDGMDFSGGEMQKLLLARAIYKNGSLLVLDEPTAALDPIAENNLYLKYRELTNGKTSLYISHRFASTRFCDRIILLEDGVITESGTHDELVKRNGQYAYMFGVQSKYYKEGEVHA